MVQRDPVCQFSPSTYRPSTRFVASRASPSFPSSSACRFRRQGRSTSAKPSDKRIGYELVVPITIPQRRELEERARKELRSLSSYVARLIVEDLAK